MTRDLESIFLLRLCLTTAKYDQRSDMTLNQPGCKSIMAATVPGKTYKDKVGFSLTSVAYDEGIIKPSSF